MASAAEAIRVLAVDIGSSSARAALFDGQGRLIQETVQRVSYQLVAGMDGRAELDAGALGERIDQLLDAVHARMTGSVQAVGISCFWHSLVGLDGQGRPTTPVSMWADTRASEAAARLRSVLDVDAHHRRTGAYLHPSYPVARLAWLRDTQPSWWDRTRFWCAFPDYLLARWTGDLVTSVSMASGTGLFDTDRLAWDEETCATLGMQTDRLPIVDDRPRRLARAYRARWPHFASAVWYPAWGDGACSNVGSGAVGTDRATVTIGTSSAVRVLWRGVPIHTPWGTWLYRLDRETVLIGGALSEGGDLVDWIRRRFVLPTEPELWDAVLAAPLGAGGLRWIPTIAGERSPRWPIDAVATLTGLRLGHDGVLVLRAAMEAIACRLARIVELLRPVNPSIETFIGSGNALLGTPGWAQLVADALGHPLVLAPDPEASLRGAALVALARLTEQPVEQLARQPVVGWQRLEPSPAATAFFRRLSAEMARLEQALAAAQDSPVTDVT